MEFLYTGLYTINSRLTISGNTSDILDSISKMRAELIVTNGVRFLNTPADGGTVEESLQYPWFNYTVQGDSMVSVEVETTLEVLTIGTQNAFTLSINNQGEDFTGVELPQDKSVLRITKHR